MGVPVELYLSLRLLLLSTTNQPLMAEI